MPEKRRKCANSDCNCRAAEGSEYCSARCEEMGGLTVTKCPCGHPECVTTAAAGTKPMGAL